MLNQEIILLAHRGMSDVVDVLVKHAQRYGPRAFYFDRDTQQQITANPNNQLLMEQLRQAAQKPQATQSWFNHLIGGCIPYFSTPEPEGIFTNKPSHANSSNGARYN